MMTTNVEDRVLTDDVGEPILQKIDKALCELSNAREDVETGKHQSAILSFLRMAKEYIESVRDDIEVVTSAYFDNLSQPQPVAQGEAVAWISTVRCVGPDFGKEYYGKLPIQSLQTGYYDHTPLYAAPSIVESASIPVSELAELMAWAEVSDDEFATFTDYQKGYTRAMTNVSNGLKNIIDSIGATPTIPTGHRVVPVEPTEEMVDILTSKLFGNFMAYQHALMNPHTSKPFWKKAITAMLAASPSAGGV